MLVDDITITFKAGDGGNGAVTFHPRRGGPSGGNGGKGGDIYLVGINDIEALSQFRFKNCIEAPDGQDGGRQDKDGRNAEDVYIKVPVSTRISINDSGWIYEIQEINKPFLIARGGRGGRGNDEFKSATNQTPRYAEKGEKGQIKKVHLELRLIARIGFVGLPNAGKSSLLRALTNARPKIGNYPFTTLEPNLGAMDNIILADIPGIIEGASSGRGLGIKFLKHIEKTSLIAHCIDITARDIVGCYKTVRKEFAGFNPELLHIAEIIILTKSDLLDKHAIEKQVRSIGLSGKKITTVSIMDKDSLNDLRDLLTNLVTQDI